MTSLWKICDLRFKLQDINISFYKIRALILLSEPIFPGFIICYFLFRFDFVFYSSSKKKKKKRIFFFLNFFTSLYRESFRLLTAFITIVSHIMSPPPLHKLALFHPIYMNENKKEKRDILWSIYLQVYHERMTRYSRCGMSSGSEPKATNSTIMRRAYVCNMVINLELVVRKRKFEERKRKRKKLLKRKKHKKITLKNRFKKYFFIYLFPWRHIIGKNLCGIKASSYKAASC